MEYRTPRNVLTIKQVKWAFEKWNSGYRWEDIGEALNVAPMTVRRECHRMYGNRNRKRQRPQLIYKGEE